MLTSHVVAVVTALQFILVRVVLPWPRSSDIQGLLAMIELVMEFGTRDYMVLMLWVIAE